MSSRGLKATSGLGLVLVRRPRLQRLERLRGNTEPRLRCARDLISKNKAKSKPTNQAIVKVKTNWENGQLTKYTSVTGVQDVEAESGT